MDRLEMLQKISDRAFVFSLRASSAKKNKEKHVIFQPEVAADIAELLANIAEDMGCKIVRNNGWIFITHPELDERDAKKREAQDEKNTA